MKRGSAWEAQLERLHDRYRRDRLAVVLRVHPPVRMLADHGKSFTGIWAGDGPPDFVGALGDGRAVAFDAKTIERGQRFPLRMIARHQARDLEAVHLAGGLAFVAFRLKRQAYALPWSKLGPLFWSWRDVVGAPRSVPVSDWWLPFDVAGDGWLPALAPDLLART